MTDEELPAKCPCCGSRDTIYESQSEYTGGGFRDSWYEFICNKCGNEWRSDKKISYY